MTEWGREKNWIFPNICDNKKKKEEKKGKNQSKSSFNSIHLCCRCEKNKKTRVNSWKRLAFEASIQNKSEDTRGWGGGGRRQMLDQRTSCREKRCETSIADADKTVLAFNIRVKESRHDTVMCRDLPVEYDGTSPGDLLSLPFFFFSVQIFFYHSG